MPTIILQGDKKIDVSLETALKAKESWKSGDETIDIGSQILKSSKIITIDFENSLNKSERKYDLNNPEDKKIIRDFERELIEATGAMLNKPIGFYGAPVKEIAAFGNLPKKILTEGMVKNDIIGLCHWSRVKYCLDNKFIQRREENGKIYWAVYPEYAIYAEKRKALDTLNDRREYASKKELESLESSMGQLVEEKSLT